MVTVLPTNTLMVLHRIKIESGHNMNLTKHFITLASLTLALATTVPVISAQESESVSVETSESSQVQNTDESTTVINEVQGDVDDHHSGHANRASFLPAEILNPDDSPYEAPEEVGEYVGYYTGQVDIPNQDLAIHIAVNIYDDGLLNLAYYFDVTDGDQGKRFFVDEQDALQEIPAPYQDVTLMTAGIQENEQGELYCGLIRKTLSPVLLINQEGVSDTIYPYYDMAYELRESYANARVYQQMGLFLQDGSAIVDVNHLIGLESDEPLVLELDKGEDANDEDAFLVENKTYEILQDSFDNYLVDHNEFNMDFDNANDFVQFIQASHLQTNKRFPSETTFELIDPENVEDDFAGDTLFALLINNEVLYVYDGSKLYVTDSVELNDGIYSSSEWVTN